ncbi:MAG TPA: hypothetical protein VGT24_03865 [Candidatus Acidoferrales bacterium]|nr:hypothetical protein [Candidatus Acidoferrales bacterium]
MPNDAKTVFNDFVQWLVGRKVQAASLFLNSLRVCIECKFGEKIGLFLWFDPVWHFGGPKGILVGSRQAQVEERDAHAALDLLVQELLGKQVERVCVDALTSDIDVQFSGGYWVRTFVSDPTDEMNWYFWDKQKNIVVSGSAGGLQLEDRPQHSDENMP